VSTQVFTNLASKSLSLERGNALAPSVEVDNTRTVKITDDAGNAVFNFKIPRGQDGSAVAIVCEMNGVKSPLSNTILIKNSVKEV
jgi:hypothetical protein